MASDPPAVDGAWWQYAACKGADPQIFFPEEPRGGNAGAVAKARAVKICHNCPVVYHCREWAVTKPETLGIWGGLDQRELGALRKHRERMKQR